MEMSESEIKALQDKLAALEEENANLRSGAVATGIWQDGDGKKHRQTIVKFPTGRPLSITEADMNPTKLRFLLSENTLKALRAEAARAIPFDSKGE